MDGRTRTRTGGKGGGKNFPIFYFPISKGYTQQPRCLRPRGGRAPKLAALKRTSEGGRKNRGQPTCISEFGSSKWSERRGRGTDCCTLLSRRRRRRRRRRRLQLELIFEGGGKMLGAAAAAAALAPNAATGVVLFRVNRK